MSLSMSRNRPGDRLASICPEQCEEQQASGDCLLHWCGGVGVAMADSVAADRSEPDGGAVRAGGHRFHRPIGLLSASPAALAGWLYVYASATVTAPVWSTVWLAAGAVAYLGWARYRRSWPLGTREIHEEFLEARRGHPDWAPSPGTGGKVHWA